VFSAPDRSVSGFATFVVCVHVEFLILKTMNSNHAAFWSSSHSTEEHRDTTSAHLYDMAVAIVVLIL
jgi:hypothetical protein